MAGLKRVSFLLSAAPFALSIPTDLSNSKATPLDIRAGGLFIREPDRYPWASLGDSFAAGPGAGPPFDELPGDCFRNNGSYPVQLHEDFPFGSNVWQFLACTGDVVDNMVNDWIPSLNEDQQVLTVSIGGNDLGFGKILRACVFKPGGPISDDCDTTIEATYTYLDNEFENTLRKGYDAIFDKIPRDYKRKVFITLYPSFFAEKTEWCNSQSMGIIPGYKPLLDNDLRHKLNILADRVRDVMVDIIERYSTDKERQLGSGWSQNRIFYLDEDVYPGHRFCEEGLETLDDPSIWFFTIGGNDSPPTVSGQEISEQYDAKTCADDPRSHTDFAFGWGCESARYVATLDGNHGDFRTYAPEYLIKAFHPKTAAFTVIKDKLKDAIRRLAWPREFEIDLGNLQCKPQRDDGDEEFYATREDMVRAMEEFCDATKLSGIQFGSNEGVFNGLIVSAGKNEEVTDCPLLDVHADDFVDVCKARLINAIDGCDVNKRSSELWKQGGSFYRDCMTWYIGTRPQIRKLSVSTANSTGI
ncbi:hypothetical protein DL765_006134 [Monosporascus sp. GIB2]|nr:hypothetical protein DL765_006134 [Monosporascus sp. GIB2]